MKLSQLHTKVEKSAKDFDSVNATYLIQGGFIDQTLAGVYSFLPLGLRVLNKVEKIIREEMDKIGTEILMSSLSPKTLWETTGRIESVDVLMKTSGANEASKQTSTKEYILSATHEELVTPIAKKFNHSYKDFPFAFYQIQTKFRNEARAKSGLLRGREFRMKDLYSFHTSEKDLMEYYEKSKVVYMNVYKRVGLGDDTYEVRASGGAFTTNYSHEFQTKCEAGEDLIFLDPKSGVAFNQEIAPSKAPTPGQSSKQAQVDQNHQSGSDSHTTQNLEKIRTENIRTMDALAEFLKVAPEQCVKTIIYETDHNELIAVALRGDYDVNEEKLKKILKPTTLRLASAEKIKETTGAEIGFAGIINLPKSIALFADDSIKDLSNFECGANETNYHFINVQWGRDVEKPAQFYDLKIAKFGDINPETGEVYETFKGSEVGNIFPLGTKYSRAFNYTFTDINGKEQHVVMGCYGLGVTRLIGVIVEKFHDDRGIIWPESIAPFQVQLVSLRGGEKKAEELYHKLESVGVEVLWDDTDASPGSKLASADLIGIPYRAVVSKRTGDKIELKKRSRSDSKLVGESELISLLKSALTI